MSDEPEGIVASIKDGDARAKVWDEYFNALYVPIIQEEPQATILPDGSTRLCYFVDFTASDWLMPRIMEALKRRPKTPNNMTVAAMLSQGIYPIIAENVTVIRGPRRLWEETDGE